MAMIDLLATSPTALTLCTFVLGLLIGSFLNVVIHRLPKMMEREFREACLMEFGSELGRAPDAGDPGATAGARYDLVVPRSTCPQCGHRITALENIPLISWLALRGRCRGCGAHIPLRYPVIEGVTGIVSALIAARYGFTLETLAILVFTWAMVPLIVIDLDHQLLPDTITLPVLWLGIVFNLFEVFVPLEDSVLGAIFGYLSLFLIYWTFKLVTGKEGMGFGDFKLLALIGAFAGWQMLPLTILLSSVVGAVVGVTLMATGKLERGRPMPFGPYLAVAGWLALVFGEDIMALYL